MLHLATALAEASLVPGVDTAGMTVLEKLLIVVVAALATIIGILFAKLEASREKLYLDARADAAVDREVAASLKTLIERSKP